MTDFSVDYFIAKFEAIPEEEWCVGHYNLGIQHCALGHCGASVKPTAAWPDEAHMLENLVTEYSVASINDGEEDDYKQPTPRQRILAALRDIKAGQE